MGISRVDLDGRGAGSPEGIVTLILRAEPALKVPVPIERICGDLDIQDIRDLETEGFEGGLITDTERSSGIILARKSHPSRRRFTLGHELGHFLIPTHMPDSPGQFLCSREDMQRLSAKENDRRGRMEVEANRFASLILMPPPLLRRRLQSRHEPDIKHMAQLANEFEVSKQAMARAYAQYNDEVLAFVFTRAGEVLLSYGHLKFPFITVRKGEKVPDRSLLMRKRPPVGVVSEISECVPDLWISVERGRTAPKMYEQVLGQRDDFAIVMLWLEAADELDEEENEDLTAKQRYQRRLERYS